MLSQYSVRSSCLVQVGETIAATTSWGSKLIGFRLRAAATSRHDAEHLGRQQADLFRLSEIHSCLWTDTFFSEILSYNLRNNHFQLDLCIGCYVIHEQNIVEAASSNESGQFPERRRKKQKKKEFDHIVRPFEGDHADVDSVGNESLVVHELVGGEGGHCVEEQLSSLLEVPDGHTVQALVDLQAIPPVPVSPLLNKAAEEKIKMHALAIMASRISLSPRFFSASSSTSSRRFSSSSLAFFILLSRSPSSCHFSSLHRPS
ncbi:hypothetical protein INR49_012596 [Caranx melampygus]|nr:hypothetical protein INR49_012596 [Caranx melampygus]